MCQFHPTSGYSPPGNPHALTDERNRPPRWYYWLSLLALLVSLVSLTPLKAQPYPAFQVKGDMHTTESYAIVTVIGIPCPIADISCLVNGQPVPLLSVNDQTACNGSISLIVDTQYLHAGDQVQAKANCTGAVTNSVIAPLSQFSLSGPLYSNSVNILGANRDCAASTVSLVIDGVTVPGSVVNVYNTNFGLYHANIPFGYLKPGQKVHLHEACNGGIDTPDITVQDVPAYVEITGSASNGVGPSEQGSAYTRHTTPVQLSSCGQLTVGGHSGFTAAMSIAESQQHIGVFRLNGNPLSLVDITYEATSPAGQGTPPEFTPTYTSTLYFVHAMINQTFFSPTTVSYSHNGVGGCNDITMSLGPIAITQVGTSGGVTNYGYYTDGNYGHKIKTSTPNPNAVFELKFDGTNFVISVDGRVIATVPRTIQYSASYGSLSNTGVLPYGSTVSFTPSGATGAGYVDVLIDGYLQQRQLVNIAPLVAPTAPANLSVAQNSAAQSVSFSGCGGTINWTGSDNSSGTGSISLSTAQAGSITYSATCTDNGCVSPSSSFVYTVTDACAGQSTTALWQNTGNTRCNGPAKEAEQKDTNTCSPTFGQTQWVVTDPTGCAPVIATPDVASTTPGVPVTIPVLSNDHCKDGSTATLSCESPPTVVTQPSCGNVVVNGDGTMTYTPTVNCPRSVSYTYQICENGNGSNCSTTTVTITIPQPCDGQNTEASWTPTGNTRCNGNAKEAEQKDLNGCSATNGQTRWVVTDPLGCGPVVANPDLTTTQPSTPVVIPVLANDKCKDGSNASLSCVSLPTVVSQPSCGNVVVNGDGTMTYTPTANCPRTVTYQYQICENGNGGNCATTTVTINIPQPCDGQNTDATWQNTGNTRCNGNAREAEQRDGNTCSSTANQTRWVVTDPNGCAPVVASPDVASTTPGVPVTIPVLSNDHCKDGSQASLSCVNLPSVLTPPSCGNGVVNSDGTITYTPTSGCPGTVTFTYQICENGNNCSTTTVTVSIPQPCDGKSTAADFQNTGNTRCNGNAREIEQRDNNACSPTSGQTRWVVSDPNGCGNPLANPDVATTQPSTPVTIPVLANDKCTDGSSASLSCVNLPTVVTQPAFGNVVVNSEGTMTYTPTANCPATVTYQYQICDKQNGGSCSTTTVTITIPQPCAGQSTNASWSNTGNTRCNGNAREAEQRDNNGCSPTSGQTRWVVTDPNGCAPVTPNVPAVSVSAPSICPGSASYLTASGCNGEVHWSTGATGTQIGVTPGSTTDYQAWCELNGTASAKTGVTVVVKSGASAPVISASSALLCGGGSSVLTATNCNGLVRWSTGATGTSIVVSPGSTTDYTVSCQTDCGSAEAHYTVIAGPLSPTPVLSASPASVCLGGQTTLSATGCAGTVNWTLGDGSHRSGQSIDVTVDRNTTYTASCNISGQCESPAGSVEVSIGSLPAAPELSASTQGICQGGSVVLTATGCQGTLNWYDAGGPLGQSGSSVTVSPAETSTYHVSCNTGRYCESAASYLTITVNPTPAPVSLAFVQNGSQGSDKRSVCEGSVLSVVAYGCDGGQVIWNDGTTGSVHPITAVQSTDYTASCQNASGCGSATSNPAQLTVLPKPAKPLLTASAPALCIGSPVTLRAAIAPGGSLVWSTGDTTSAITVSPVVSTTYSVQQTLNGCPSDTAAVWITVNPLPLAPGVGIQLSDSLLHDSVSVCAGKAVTLLTASACEGTIQWSNGGTGSRITVSPTVSTTYSAVCISTLTGCTSPASNTIAVHVDAPTVVPQLAPAGLNICQGDTVRLQIANLPAGYTPLWSTGNSTSTSLVLTKAGAYAVAFRDAMGCVSAASDTAYVNVFKRPAKPVLENQTAMDVLVTDDQNPSPYVYRWFVDTNRVLGAAGLQFRPDGDGTITAERRAEYYLPIANTNPVRYDTLVCPVRASIPVKAGGDLLLFPNPTEGPVTIETRGSLKLSGLKVNLWDELGREIYDGYTSTLENGKLVVDMTWLPDAVYVLQVYSDTYRSTWKVIKLSKK